MEEKITIREAFGELGFGEMQNAHDFVWYTKNLNNKLQPGHISFDSLKNTINIIGLQFTDLTPELFAVIRRQIKEFEQQ